MELMSHKLSNGKTVIGTVYSIVQLSAKFQIWARQFGLSDAESLACWVHSEDEKKARYFGLSDSERLACWVHGNDDEKQMYFKAIEMANELAVSGFAKLENVEIPDLSEI